MSSRLRDLRLRTNYAGGGGGAGASFDDAVGDAGDLLLATAGVPIRILALALLGRIGWLAGRILRHRRRESALV